MTELEALRQERDALVAALAAAEAERDAARAALRMLVHWGVLLDADDAAPLAAQRAMGVPTAAEFEAQYGFGDLATLRRRVFAALGEESEHV